MRLALRTAGTAVALALTLGSGRPAEAWGPHSTVRHLGVVAIRQPSVRQERRSAADDPLTRHDRLPATAHRPIEATWSAITARRDDARMRRRLAELVATGPSNARTDTGGRSPSIVASRAVSVLGAVFHEAHAPPRRVSSVAGCRS